MGLKPSNTSITSSVSPHSAWCNDDGSWTVSWFGAVADKNKAITAMNLAEIAAEGTSQFERGSWELAQAFAAELGFTDVREALKLADRPAVKS